MNVDLPNLEYIADQDEGDSFRHPRVVTLESISYYWILIEYRYSLFSRSISMAFPVCSIEINFEYYLFDMI